MFISFRLYSHLNNASVGKNPNLYEATSHNHQMDETNKKRKKSIVIPVGASVAGTVLLLVIVAGAIICAVKKREPQSKTTTDYHLQYLIVCLDDR